MKSLFISCLLALVAFTGNAQDTKVSIEASGLTCSMCSKAVLTALQEVENVSKVRVDIKNQQYHVNFVDDSSLDFDALVKAVEDAGFSVASFKVATKIDKLKLEKDQHVLIGKQYFHFLNASGEQLDGSTSFTIVDKNYTTSRNFKKYSVLSTMECVETGKASSCCSSGNIAIGTRIFHVII